MEQGFEQEMHQIVKVLPKQRQSVLFSATQTKKVQALPTNGSHSRGVLLNMTA